MHKNPEDPDTFNKITMGGWIQLVKRSPAILQTYIAGQISLRRRVVGERFWKRVEKMCPGLSQAAGTETASKTSGW